ncbi:hypothetical protein ACPJHQ_09865 [Rossellomorea sp. H39__3]
MVCSDLYRLVIVLLMITAQTSLSWLVVLIFLQGVGNLFFEPAKTALIPSLIKKSPYLTRWHFHNLHSW